MKYVKYFLLVLAVSFILANLSFSKNPTEGSLPEETISQTDIPETSPTATVTATESIIITTAPPVTVTVTETEKTTTASETTITVSETTVTEAVTEETTTVTETAPIDGNISGIIKTAMEQLDKPYTLGGASPQGGFDSSGLIQYACKQNGIDFPRYSSQQSKIGTEVSYRDLQAGDFMYLSMDDTDNIKYCGIYLGNGKMLYSSTKQEKVLIISVASPYWEQHMVTARRIS